MLTQNLSKKSPKTGRVSIQTQRELTLGQNRTL